MPVIDDLNLSPKTRVVIWEINESIQDLKSKVVLSEDSLKLLNQKKSEIHKKQFLAIRNIFKFLCIDNKDVEYDKAGKPIFSQNKKLSISHSGKYAAVITSNYNVGIDIEKISDKAIKIKHKFLQTELNYPIEFDNFENYLMKGFVQEGHIHRFFSEGTYVASLTAVDSNGIEGFAESEIIIDNIINIEPPT